MAKRNEDLKKKNVRDGNAEERYKKLTAREE